MPERKQDIHPFGSLSDDSLIASFASFPSPVFLMDNEGEILHTGGSFLSKTGEDAGWQRSGSNDPCPVSGVGYTPLAVSVLKEKAQEVLKTGKPCSFKDIQGSVAWMHTIYPLYTPDGGLNRFLVIAGKEGVNENTKRRGGYTDLEVLNTLHDAIPASVIVVDAHMRLIGWNQFSRDTINGRSEEEMLGVNPFLRIHPEDREYILGLFLRVVICDVEASAKFRMHHKDSEDYKWATLRCRRVVIEGQPCVVSVVTETTELKKAEEEREKLQEQLQQSQKMELIGKLAGGIAHDFNNILTGIIGNTEMLLGMIDQSSPYFGNINDILRLANRSAKLTGQLLAFARKEVMRPRIMDLNEAVAELLPLQQRIIGENIRLVFHSSETPVFVNFDPVQLDQVLTNLFVNSRDAITESGTILISCEAASPEDHSGFQDKALLGSGEYVRLSVTDTGCGIEEKVLPHIFEPFFTTREAGKGTGLGLSTVYGIVKQNQGHIFCRTHIGKGTTFDIYLPLHEKSMQEHHEAPKVQMPSNSKESILLVEDEPYVLRIMKDILESHRFTVYTAGNAEEGLLVAHNQRNLLNLLVTDVMLPKTNGVQLSMQLLKYNPGLKVLFMSGYAPEYIGHMRKFDKGANFIQKPFMINDFMKAVHKALSLP
ncbi:MAG: response regulator [Chlorobiaceae bacterium]|nr:response regulator [Chlorobiaceae bacterium]NTV61682.1 response regulator [Chlorobiaceae bacterium]